MIYWIEEASAGGQSSVCWLPSSTGTASRRFTTSQRCARLSTMVLLSSMTLRTPALYVETNNASICYMVLTLAWMLVILCILHLSTICSKAINLLASSWSQWGKSMLRKWQACMWAKAGIYYGTMFKSCKETTQLKITTFRWQHIKLEFWPGSQPN